MSKIYFGNKIMKEIHSKNMDNLRPMNIPIMNPSLMVPPPIIDSLYFFACLRNIAGTKKNRPRMKAPAK